MLLQPAKHLRQPQRLKMPQRLKLLQKSKVPQKIKVLQKLKVPQQPKLPHQPKVPQKLRLPPLSLVVVLGLPDFWYVCPLVYRQNEPLIILRGQRERARIATENILIDHAPHAAIQVESYADSR